MSAELNVKLVLGTSDIQRQLSDLQKKVGGSMSKPVPGTSKGIEQIKDIQKESSERKKNTISLADAAKGMLRSLLMYRAISEAMSNI